jgi:DNA-binding LytR/AlgR family response regulator
MDAKVARSVLDLFNTNFLFTDIQLGGPLSGWDVAEALRAQDPELAVVYASGKSADGARQVSRSLFFAKPYKLAEIVDACSRLTHAGNKPFQN